MEGSNYFKRKKTIDVCWVSNGKSVFVLSGSVALIALFTLPSQYLNK